MRYYLPAILFVTVTATSCDSSAPANTSIDTGYVQVPLVTDVKPSDSLHNMDTSLMVVDSMSRITFNGVPMEKKDKSIYNTVYNSWMYAYQQTGHLPLSFRLVQQGTVTVGIRGTIGEAVTQAQEDMKNYIAKDKFRKKFGELSGAEKDSLQQMHPVLFKKPF